MSKRAALIAGALLIISLVSSASYQIRQTPQIDTRPQLKKLKLDIDYGKIPLYFIPNEGQVADEALFYADTSKYTLWITKDGLVFDSLRKLDHPKQYERDVSRVTFLNADPQVEVIPEENSDYKVSYFRGKDSSRWQTGIETSHAVLYSGLYHQIDLRVYGIEQEIEYDFIVKPEGEVEDIGFKYQDVQGTKLDEEGNLIIQTIFGELIHTRPVAFQYIQSKRIEVDASFKRIGDNTYGFDVGPYDKTHDLIIDPLVIVYSTYFGGKGGEGTTYLAVDMTGAVYVCCWVSSKNYPTKNPFYSKFSGVTDANITKLSPDGKSLIYSSYLGGTEQDGPLDIAVDITGAAYLTGVARSDFPTVNALYEYQGGGDAFVVKVDPAGTALVYSTYLGGSDFDRARGMAVDDNGNAYITGLSRSTDFPTKKAFQKKNAGIGDAFLTKINPTGSALVFSTYFGGSEEETGLDVAIDDKHNIYIIGDTVSKDIPKKKAFQKKNAGGNDTFVAKFNKYGKKLIYSTFLGGAATEETRDIDVDMWGNAYIIGKTNSSDFPTKNALYPTLAGDYDVYLTKLKPNGKKLAFSTYMGGAQADAGFKVIDAMDNTIYIGGVTESKKFPTKDAFMKKYQGNGDVFLAQLSADGQNLIFSTFFGGSKWDRGVGLDIDNMGGIYLASGTESPDIPVKNAFQKNKKGLTDMFITKFKKE